MSMEHSKELMNLAADNIRILAASMVERAKSGHPGGAMGGADFKTCSTPNFLISTLMKQHGVAVTAFSSTRVICRPCYILSWR